MAWFGSLRLTEFVKSSPNIQLGISANKLPQYETTHSPPWWVTTIRRLETDWTLLVMTMKIPAKKSFLTLVWHGLKKVKSEFQKIIYICSTNIMINHTL